MRNLFVMVLMAGAILSCQSPEPSDAGEPEASSEPAEILLDSLLAQQNSEDQIVAVIDAFHEALVAGDSTIALSHLADDVIILESGGVENKEHYSSGHLAGDMRFAQAMQRKRGEMKVSIMGDVAWAHSSSVTQGRMGDREINSQGAELVVLARENGRWHAERR